MRFNTLKIVPRNDPSLTLKILYSRVQLYMSQQFLFIFLSMWTCSVYISFQMVDNKNFKSLSLDIYEKYITYEYQDYNILLYVFIQ